MDSARSGPAASDARRRPEANSGHRRRILILGAAGRDFHNFNVVYRHDPAVEVVAFTAAQIPGIANRRYPSSLAGVLYPDGIPIVDEGQLDALCRNRAIDEVVFAYSDVSHEHVMHMASRALATGADFSLLGPKSTMLTSMRPVIAITAVRTGCGKSALARWISKELRGRGLRVAVLRHPMPYGELAKQSVQRFASLADVIAAQCTVEEREEYEPHLATGSVVFAGIDYAEILRQAESEAEVIVWDGGNNDFPFVRPNLIIAMADALRPLQVATHHPGETVARMADVLIVSKVDSALPADVDQTEQELRAVNPAAPILRAALPIKLDDAPVIRGKRALVIEDGPTVTHGGMPYGAGYLAAQQAGAIIIDPRTSAPPLLRKVFDAYPHIGNVLPAVGYQSTQLAALERTINESAAEIVVSATPIDLARLLKLNKTVVRARYEFAEAGKPKLSELITIFVDRALPRGGP
jgi:predicted GTPase